ncbi:MAG: UDP-N-acetylmuramoyl-L-alanine--D-glutamate ligase [Candidatus Caenarcaniphilales bacterium]|nr:UDP-N-acetylmuramoyl-L-alanine--D-glutamate ligase [Candidatus Caenarcaniphilales bacterium]
MEKIAILGLGKTALSLIRHALDDDIYNISVIEQKERNQFEQIEKDIQFLSDEGIKFHFGTQDLTLLDDVNIVAVSPGFKPDSEIIQHIIKLVEEDKLKYLTDLDLFLTKLHSIKDTVNAVNYVAITGTNGKTTTSELTAHLLETVAVGNNGRPMLDFWSLSRSNKAVLELSSFQLFYSKTVNIHRYPPQAAIYLNLTEDHMDWHRDMDEYKWSKKKMFALSTKKENSLIFNYDDPYLRELAIEFLVNKKSLNDFTEKEEEKIKTKIKFFSVKENLAVDPLLSNLDCAYISDNEFSFRLNGEVKELCPLSVTKLKGEHNYANCLASILAASDFLDIYDSEFTAKLSSFKAVPHRLEYVNSIDGKDFYNDSKATNPESAIKSLNAFESSIAIIGGKNKNLDLSKFLETVKTKTKFVYIIGELKDTIASGLDQLNFKDYKKVSDLEEALELASAYPAAIPVILAPASSSFDMFKSFEERGEIFKDIVLRFSNSKSVNE